MSSPRHYDNHEALRLQSPESMTSHRRAIIANAVQNLRPFAPVEASVMPSPVPVSEEVAAYAASQEAVAEAERITRQAAQFKQETSVDRIMQSVDAIYEGQGNPLYDQETL